MVSNRIHEFDFVISYAGEDELLATHLKELLVSGGAKVFFAPDFSAELWGENLYEYLADIYMNKGVYCIILVSKSYVQKYWTLHEWRNAQARIITAKNPYLLPIRLDTSELVGLNPNISYLEITKFSIEKIAELALKKLGIKKNQKREELKATYDRIETQVNEFRSQNPWDDVK